MQWTRMGDGNMGMEDYIRTYVAKCPGTAVSLEVIVSNDPAHLQLPRSAVRGTIFQTTPAWEFARFLALCDRGVPRELPAPGRGVAAEAAVGRGGGAGGGQPNPEAQRINREHVEASLQWTRDVLAKV